MAPTTRGLIVLCLVIIIAISACQSEEQEPVLSSPAATIAGKPLQPVSVSPITLVRNPSALEDQYIELAGNYKQLPIQVCAGESHSSPIGWHLATGDLEIPASGFEQQLRDLGEDGLPLVVEGRWKQWEGPVGCGRRVPVQQIWYLAVTEIISPNPLTAVQKEAGEVAEVPGSVVDITAAPPVVTVISLATDTAVPVIQTATAQPYPIAINSVTPELQGSPTEAATPGPSITSTPAISITGTGTQERTGPVTETPESNQSPTSGATGTATPTGTPTLSPSATPISNGTEAPTRTATPTETSEDILLYENIISSVVEAGAVKRWDFIGSENDITTISLAPELGLDVAIELISPDGATLVTQNEGGPGETETIDQITLNSFGTYGIRVKSMNNSDGGFALALSDSESEAFLVYVAVLNLGTSGTEDVPAGTDHLFAFQGSAGDRVTFEVESVTASNMVLYLYSPGGDELEFIDDDESSTIGAQEKLTSYPLPTSGMYTFRVGEWDFNAASYQYSITQGQ
ncbi:MAG: hypothetical protein BMS9Abin02_1815 [Anaerolineae bacterium]|nr:MAG: hypothetical protein BMS9Abin02_1815 [Anaerolineae bacterium]